MDRTDVDFEDEVYEVLGSPRRRLVLGYLAALDEPAHLHELSRAIAAFESDVPPEDVGRDGIQRIYVSLYQTHIPTLEAAGLVEYDDQERFVHLLDCPDEMAAVLHDRDRDHRKQAIVNLVLAFTLGGLLVFSQSLPSSVSHRILLAVLIGIVVAFLVMSVGRYYRTCVSEVGDTVYSALLP